MSLIQQYRADICGPGLDPATLDKLKQISATKPVYMYDFEGKILRHTYLVFEALTAHSQVLKIPTLYVNLCIPGNKFRPKLTLFLEDQVAIDARLSSRTRKYLEDLVTNNRRNATESLDDFQKESIHDLETSSTAHSGVHSVQVPIKFDAEFFGQCS